ncbi:terminase large subunit domain-containing protein [Nostoc flagelliforme]|nr:terminase family protein [Nostoc flagelliforme]
MAAADKSFALLLECLRHTNNPRFGAVLFRQSFTQIVEEGALWDSSEEIYPLVGGYPRKSAMEWLFPSGAKVGFAHLGHENDKFKYQGSQIPLLCFDELTHFSESAFFYMLSRNRSTSGVKPYMRGTTNPDADSWIAKYIDWWIDTEGFPLPERSGVVRWFIRKSGELIWANDPDTLRDRYGLSPKSFTFVASNIYDNQILLAKDPDYLSNLQALHPIDQARLLGGNWKVKPESGKVFNRTWYEIVDEVPEGGMTVRFWDLAATEKTTACFTSGTKMRCFPPSDAWYGDTFFVMDNIMQQIGPAGGDDLIIKTAAQDGRICKVRWELEGGSSGIRDEAHLKKLLQGFDAKGVAPMGDKVKRAKPFATDSYHGKVKLLRGAWNDSYLGYLQDFPDGPVKDPIDSSSGAHASLTEPTGPKSRIGKYRT